jgi:hypothetical protein
MSQTTQERNKAVSMSSAVGVRSEERLGFGRGFDSGGLLTLNHRNRIALHAELQDAGPRGGEVTRVYRTTCLTRLCG